MQRVQNDLHLQSSNLAISAKSLLPCRIVYSQVLRIRKWAFGGHYSAYYPQLAIIMQ